MQVERESTGLFSFVRLTKSEDKMSDMCNLNEDNNDLHQCTPANYEKAVKAAGFGKYNLMIILTLIPPALAACFSTSSMSYVFPIAQCDLNLTLSRKGILNSATYFGMLSSGLIWGFLTDSLGRKRLIIYVFMLNGLFVTLCSVSQTFIYLTVTKFFEGFIVNGGNAALLSYTNEFQSSEHRRIVPLINGMFVSISGIILPLLCWIIFTDSVNIQLFNNLLVLRSWNILLLVTSLPSFTAGFIYMLLPESPKFLMTVGKNGEALQILNKMYKYNTGNAESEYPIKVLINESEVHKGDKHKSSITTNRSNIQALKEGLQQITILFYPPHSINLLLILIVHFGFSMGMNTIRLWLPQLFTAINDYKSVEKHEKYEFCATINTLTSGKMAKNETCFVNYDNANVYINNSICTTLTVIVLICTIPILKKLGKKIVLSSVAIISGLCILLVYFANSITLTIGLFSFHVGLTYVALNTLIGAVIDLFPTYLRAITISAAFVSGRLGSSTGNLIFPILLNYGCQYPFLLIGSINIACGLLSIVLPNSDGRALQ